MNDIEKIEEEDKEDSNEKRIPLDDLAEKDITRLSSVTDQNIQLPQQESTVTNTQGEQGYNNPFQNNFGIKKESTSSVPQNAKKFSFL